MRRIWSWYLRYADAVDRLLTRLIGCPYATFGSLVLMLAGMGLWTGWEPYRALLKGVSPAGPIVTYGKLGPVFTPLWLAGLFPTVMLVCAASIPTWFLVTNSSRFQRFQRQQEARAPKSRRRTKRTPATHTSRHWARWPSIPEEWWAAIPAILLGLTIMIPLWRTFEALSAGSRLSENVNISPWYPSVPLPAWTVFIYAFAMARLGRRAFELRRVGHAK